VVGSVAEAIQSWTFSGVIPLNLGSLSTWRSAIRSMGDEVREEEEEEEERYGCNGSVMEARAASSMSLSRVEAEVVIVEETLGGGGYCA